MNTAIDNHIETLKKGSEVPYNGDRYIIQSCDAYELDVLEVGETNREEIMTLTWSDISEELEVMWINTK